jgi:hypothetical protein
LLATDFAVINVASGAEVVAAGNSVDEIVYNRQTGNLFYNSNNAAQAWGEVVVGLPQLSVLPITSPIQTSSSWCSHKQ